MGMGSGVFNFKYGGWKNSSDELTFEQRLEGKEGEGHMVMREWSREGVPGRGNSGPKALPGGKAERHSE